MDFKDFVDIEAEPTEDGFALKIKAKQRCYVGDPDDVGVTLEAGQETSWIFLVYDRRKAKP